MSSQDGDFEELIESVGGYGFFQKRLLYVVVVPLCFILPLAFFSQVSVLHVPAYTCNTPEQIMPDSLNISNSAWQSLVFKQALNMYYMMAPDHCTYYDLSQEKIGIIKSRAAEINEMDATALTELATSIQEGMNLTSCTDWAYDKSQFQDSAVTENDWICDKAMYIADLYTLSTVGLVLGAFIFSAVNDGIGRKYGFLVGLFFIIAFTLCQIPTSFSFELFGFFKVFATFGLMPGFQSPFSILSEITDSGSRNKVLVIICVFWGLGQMFYPLLAWIVAKYSTWKVLKAASVLPLLPFFFFWGYLPESPRWLISKKKSQDAVKVLREIGQTNGKIIPDDLEAKVNKLCNATKEKSLGYISLFSSWRLAFRTFLITIAFTASSFIYYQMVINVSNMGGNPFLNLFLMGLSEAPGNILGGILAEKAGRRWSHTFLLFNNGVLFASIMPGLYYPTSDWATPVTSTLCMLIKLNIAASFFIAYVQAMEIFPTPIRQSGVGIATVISQIISIGGPYVISLGMVDIKLPYLVMMGVCFVGAFATIFLPETHDVKLPETLEEASVFGSEDKFWSWKPKRYQVPAGDRLVDKETQVPANEPLVPQEMKDMQQPQDLPPPPSATHELKVPAAEPSVAKEELKV